MISYRVSFVSSKYDLLLYFSLQCSMRYYMISDLKKTVRHGFFIAKEWRCWCVSKYMHSARTHNIKKKNIKVIWTLQFRCLDAGCCLFARSRRYFIRHIFLEKKPCSSVLHVLFMVREGGKRQQVSIGGVKWSGNWVRPYTGMGSPHYLTQGTRTDSRNGGLLDLVLWKLGRLWTDKNFKRKTQCCFIVIDYILMTTLGFAWKSNLSDWRGHILSVRDCGSDG